MDMDGPVSESRGIGPSVIYTIGHSTRSFEDFAALLKREEIDHLVDIRTFPSSKRYPHFNGDNLRASLGAMGIGYRHAPGLGGRRAPVKNSPNMVWRNAGFRGYADYMETNEFRSALSDLIAESKAQSVAIMCAEAVPWRCHRNMVSDALVAAGVEVKHILDATVSEHTLSPLARVENGIVTYRALQPSLFGE